MTMNDTHIIDNTHFETREDTLYCYTLLPDGDRFEEAVPSKEVVQKNMIGWCNTVREYVKQKRQAAEEEAIARKKRGPITEAPATQPKKVDGDPKAAVLLWYEGVQSRIDELGEQIEALQQERNELRDERDKMAPVIRVWKGEVG